MSRYNTNSTHPLIPNSNQYLLEKKYVSICSEDRNIMKYPNPSTFEIELPQDYLNVQSVKLHSWSFPSNYHNFSSFNNNLTMTFRFKTLYNPNEHSYSDPLQDAIFAGLYANLDKFYFVIIESGIYTPQQMATELTNKFNESVTNVLLNYFTDNPSYAYAIPLFTNGYTNFKIVYNLVGENLWFGNTSDQFVLENDLDQSSKNDCAQCLTHNIVTSQCLRRNIEPSFNNWGLPSYLGFTRGPITALNPSEFNIHCKNVCTHVNVNNGPRFYYGDVVDGDDGYWLLPTLPGATVYFLQTPLKFNLTGPTHIYMEIAGLNCVDETSTYNLSNFTRKTNETNGCPNSFFSKIPITNTFQEQFFDNDQAGPYKWFNPPAERIRKLKIKFRYHDGQLVDFGPREYSFLLEFSLLSPQSLQNSTIKDAATSSLF